MRRHPLDALSFVFGLLFLGLAGASLAGWEVVGMRWEWLVAGGLVILGGVLLLSAARSRGSAEEDGER